MGVGYGNIQSAINGQVVTIALLTLMILKCVSWMIALSSGTSGGTLAPLMTVGACLGALLGRYAAFYCPSLGLNPEVAALVATAAIFAGASRALLTSMFFVLETTWQPAALLPILVGSGAAYVVSGILMQTTIMTEKIVRRGVVVPTDYGVDVLAQTQVDRVASKPAVTLSPESSIATARALLTQYPYRSFPLTGVANELVGCVLATEIMAAEDSNKLLADIAHSSTSIGYDASAREAVTKLCLSPAFCLPVVDETQRVVGVVTQKDIFRVWH
jgi:CBS domain-containing protein